MWDVVNGVIVDSSNGLALVWCQAIAWMNAALLYTRISGMHFSEAQIKIQ